MKLAPVVLFVFNRPDHLKKSLESLCQNRLVSQTDLYIFSDGPRNDIDIDKVNEVRKIIKSITAFKSVTITLETTNKGLAQSVIKGVNKVFDKHSSVIVIEDDLLYSPFFIEYMNHSLLKYEHNPQISSVSGYMFPVQLNHNTPNFFLLPRPNSWGWATWKYDWETIDWDVLDYEKFKKDTVAKKNFNKGGDDLTPMLIKQKMGLINSWAVRWAYHHSRNNTFCFFPKNSFVKNIGMDGSGTHQSTKTSEITDFSFNPSELPELPKTHLTTINSVKQFFDTSLIRKVINYFKLEK